MAVLACLQLEAFVLVAATALWVDILRETAISVISEHTGVYRTAVILTMVVMYSHSIEMQGMLTIYRLFSLGLLWYVSLYRHYFYGSLDALFRVGTQSAEK